MDDEMLLEINSKYLNHNYYTDIISFDYSENNIIAGDIYISIDRVRENALNTKTDFEDELHRVLVHGILHFLGYKDKRPEEKKRMRDAENSCLKLLKPA
jgi:rRNA maturation RNase YbeY